MKGVLNDIIEYYRDIRNWFEKHYHGMCNWLRNYKSLLANDPVRYSGLEFILSKFIPPKEENSSEPLPTGPIWLLGVYVAFWTLALERYEYRVHLIETRVNSIYAELGTSDLRKNALGRISEIQSMKCPNKPHFFDPFSIFYSMVSEQVHEEIAEQLKQIVEDSKEELDGVTLQRAKLQMAKLQGAKFQRAILYEANLQGAKFYGADLRRARLQKAKLQRARLQEADLRRAKLQRAKLQGAKLHKADLRGTDLREAKQ